MNEMREAHVKAMAHKIEEYAEASKLRMQAIQRNSLADMPTNIIGIHFQEVTDSCEAMQRIVNGELSNLLPLDELEKCEVCDRHNGPFTRVEVSDDEGPAHWLKVCSDKDACLNEVIKHWKQIGEVIRPER